MFTRPRTRVAWCGFKTQVSGQDSYQKFDLFGFRNNALVGGLNKARDLEIYDDFKKSTQNEWPRCYHDGENPERSVQSK